MWRPIQLNASSGSTAVASDSMWARIQRRARLTGSVAPSSVRLADELASLAAGFDQVIELGAGSGAVTRALTHVVSPDRLEAVELQIRLVTILRETYPHVEVTHGTADFALDRFNMAGATAVVSSLPFRSLPADVKQLTVQSVLRFLVASPSSRLIQFTYGLREPFLAPPGFEWRRIKWVMSNLPPACIWILSKLADEVAVATEKPHDPNRS